MKRNIRGATERVTAALTFKNCYHCAVVSSLIRDTGQYDLSIRGLSLSLQADNNIALYPLPPSPFPIVKNIYSNTNWLKTEILKSFLP
jgi:hypothetical protein